jgi:hypothetical protein
MKTEDHEVNNEVRNLAACFTLDQAAGILEFSPEQSQQLLKKKKRKKCKYYKPGGLKHSAVSRLKGRCDIAFLNHSLRRPARTEK